MVDTHEGSYKDVVATDAAVEDYIRTAAQYNNEIFDDRSELVGSWLTSVRAETDASLQTMADVFMANVGAVQDVEVGMATRWADFDVDEDSQFVGLPVVAWTDVAVPVRPTVEIHYTTDDDTANHLSQALGRRVTPNTVISKAEFLATVPEAYHGMERIQSLPQTFRVADISPFERELVNSASITATQQKGITPSRMPTVDDDGNLFVPSESYLAGGLPTEMGFVLTSQPGALYHRASKQDLYENLGRSLGYYDGLPPDSRGSHSLTVLE